MDTSVSATSGSNSHQNDDADAVMDFGTNPMTEWLNSDADTPSATLRYLPLRDIVHLCCTSKSWRDYISNPKHNFRCQNTIQASPQKLVLAAKSSWISRCLHSLHYISKSSRVEPDFFTYSRFSGAQQISLLHSFPNLHSLEFDTLPLVILPDMFQPISKLTSLQSLIVRCNSHEMRSWDRFAQVSLAPLANCKELATFKVQLETWFYCTKQQVLDLLECKSLTNLDCGMWAQTSTDGSGNKEMVRTAEQRTAEGLALLHQLPRLRELELKGQRLSDVELHHLCKISSLTTIRPLHWMGNINSQQWAELRNLKALSDLYYAPLSASQLSSQTSSTDAFIELLPQLPSLTALSMNMVTLGTGQLETLLSMRTLTSLKLLECTFPSLSSFAQAASTLQQLLFQNCRDSKEGVFHYHMDLPVIPSLKSIKITEYWYARNKWSNVVKRSRPIEAMTAAFKFMISKRFNILESDIEYAWLDSHEDEDIEDDD